jgi:aldoxime dehydratase
LIRSGQDWSGTDDAERALYLDDVEPSLRAGMDFLSSDGASIGCLHNRYLRIVDDAGAATDRTYGMSWWRTLGDLETWAASHPTHLRIFGAFGRLVRQQGERTRLRLYHEVTVATPDQQWFAYHRCRPGTGLLIADPARPA